MHISFSILFASIFGFYGIMTFTWMIHVLICNKECIRTNLINMDVIPVTVHVNVYNLTLMTISQTRSFKTLYIGV